MTAVVGILNKHAIAIAADSAVTIGNNGDRKIFNKANKVFALSKQHPVGIMIYNSASFMGTPWETLIKVYRKQLASNSFLTLNDYKNDFIEFLRSKKFYTDSEMQLAFMENFANEIIQSVINEIALKNRVIFDTPSEENRTQLILKLEEEFERLSSEWSLITDLCPEFIDYTFEEFQEYSNTIFDKLISSSFTSNGIIIPEELQQKIMNVIYYILTTKTDTSNYTGLIFTGFGDDEIYPQLIPINITMVVDNKLRYFVNENKAASISNMNSGAVCPFAQTDVIDTILTGIDPSLDTIYLNNFEILFKKYNEEIITAIGTSNPLLIDQIKKLDRTVLLNEFSKQNQEIRKENYIIPLMNAVSNLAKEDLAEMAESLIYLTYLKRRITFAEESVGGPVDVAVISKGDGFVWIKRKHYFRPELNQHFFENYFKI